MELNAHIIEECCRTLLPGYDAWQHDGSCYFDHAQALRACEFFQEVLTFTTAGWLGRPLLLEGGQVAVLGNVHGWRRKSDGLRRYRRVLLTTARKSGKSAVAGGLGV